MRWFERRFEFNLPPLMLPQVLQRLRGTPARLDERLRTIDARLLTTRPAAASWSIQEHAGHLADLEPLWIGRVEDFLERRPDLRAADLTNRATEEARHNDRALPDILADFRRLRADLIRRLEEAQAVVTWTARHPRLQTEMRLIDHAQFVADHDDHHLAAIEGLLQKGPA